MTSVGQKRASELQRWRYEDEFTFIKSIIGSVIEFREKCGRRQRVVGTLDKCANNSFNLVDTTINGEYFGDYVIADYEVHKWRIKELRKLDKPLKDWTTKRAQTKRSDSSTKYLIPSHLQELSEKDDDLLKKFVDQPYCEEDMEAIDLKEDEEPVHINLDCLSQKASNDIVFIDEINEDFDDVIHNIIKCNSVGFAVFGNEVSREGVIDLMAFATPTAIYVFDSTNRDIVFGLQTILESKELQKVMFALRHPSDALYHLFDINLDNAVDVRIWDFCLQKKSFISAEISVKPELRSFEAILWLYLRVKVPKFQRNLDFRQFSTKIENFVRLKTVFLKELFVLINNKLLKEAYLMNSRCLRSLRSAEELEYIAVKADERELEIIENPSLEYEETERKIISLATNKPINGFKGKEIIIDSNQEILIDSDEEIDEIMVRLTPK